MTNGKITELDKRALKTLKALIEVMESRQLQNWQTESI